jgi:integrase
MSALFFAIDNLPHKAKSTEAVVAPVMFRLIYTCGLRPNEGRELLRENIDLKTGEIQVVKTKRKKERLVVMSDDMLALCQKYSATIKTQSQYFFPRFDGDAYTATQVDRLFKNCWVTANPGAADLPNVRTTDLRHRFASARLNRWLDEGRDLNIMLLYLRAFMGHEDLSETAYYIHVLPENLVKSAGVDWDSLNSLLPEVSIWQP